MQKQVRLTLLHALVVTQGAYMCAANCEVKLWRIHVALCHQVLMRHIHFPYDPTLIMKRGGVLQTERDLLWVLRQGIQC